MLSHRVSKISNLNSQLEEVIKEDGEESIYAENIRLAIQERESELGAIEGAGGNTTATENKKDRSESGGKVAKANDGYSKRKYDLQSALDTLGEYDTVRSRHIESSENDKISRNYQEIKEFIKNSTKHNPVKRLHIGRVNDTVAAMVKAKTGKNIKDYDLVIASNFIAHIFDQHGNPKKETPRGQIAVDFQNIENIIETVISPDDVKITKDNNGAEALQFEKDIEGHNIAITITSTKKSTLTLKSAWIINKNSGGRTPSANANTFAGTSKTNGRSSTNNSIHQNAPNVKTSAKNKNDLSKSDASASAKTSKSQTSAKTETKESENSDNEYEYSSEIQKKARKACKVFDMLSYERKAAICELIKSNDGTLDNTNVKAISAILASRQGLFAFVGSLNDNNVVWKNGSFEVVDGVENTRVITIAKDSEVINDSKDKQGALAQTFIHEVIHDMKVRLNSAYKELVRTAYKYISKERAREITDLYTKNMVGTSFSEWLEKNKGKSWSDYLAAFPAVDSEAITEEVTAKFIGEALGGTKYIKYLADQKVSTLRSVARMTKTVAKMIFGKNATTDRMMFDVYASFKSALDSVEFGSVGGEVKEKFDIAYTTDNRPVVVIENDILAGVSKKDWIKTVKKEIQRFSPAIPIKGRLIRVSGKTANEYVHSKYSDSMRMNNAEIYRDKLKAAGHLDEIIVASTQYTNEDLKHQRKDNITEFARGDVLMRIGNNEYSAEVVIGYTNSKEMLLYDIIGFKTESFSMKTKKTGSRTVFMKQTASDDRSGVPVTNSIPENSQNVNTSGKKSVKYDLSETKNEKKYGAWSGQMCGIKNRTPKPQCAVSG